MEKVKGHLIFKIDPFELLKIAQSIIEWKDEIEKFPKEKKMLFRAKRHFIQSSVMNCGEVNMVFQWNPEFDKNGKIIEKCFDGIGYPVICCETAKELEDMEHDRDYYKAECNRLGKKVKSKKGKKKC